MNEWMNEWMLTLKYEINENEKRLANYIRHLHSVFADDKLEKNKGNGGFIIRFN